MKTLIIALFFVCINTKASEFKCIATGKTHSTPLTQSGPAHAIELEGIVFNAEETGNTLTLAMYDEDGVGAKVEFPVASVTKLNPANLTLTFINGAPNLKCSPINFKTFSNKHIQKGTKLQPIFNLTAN